MAFDAPVSFNRREFELFSLASPTITPDLLPLTPVGGLKRWTGSPVARTSNLSFSDLPTTEKHHQAATRLQKVYKSFRTRRRLADCAVLVEQRWWKLMDFAELKRSSISFFDIEQHETAISRWTRATTRAAKVGKGLSKDERARKLALQHWLEAIDPRHRYGHNLQFYYARWLHCDSNQPFFYWLDIGEGKEVNHERCPRQKLQHQCIKYLGPIERMAYEVAVDDGKFIFRRSGELVDTTHGPEDAKWIFVLSTSKVLYVGQKNKGTFQHSSFLAGGVTLFAGRLIAEAGVLKAVWAHSGHYLPTEENFQDLMSFLEEHNVDLSNVKKSPTVEEVADLVKQREPVPRCSSESDFTAYAVEAAQPKIHRRKLSADSEDVTATRSSTLSKRLGLEISKLEIPQKIDAVYMFRRPDIPGPGLTTRPIVLDSPSEDGYETAEETFAEEDFMVSKSHLFDKYEEDEQYEDIIPKEKIMKRIDSHKGLKSYQLARQLPCRWTTGAGPRIGCMRDYPLELQVRVLEQTNLTPREVAPRGSTPRVLSRFSSPNLQSPMYTDARTGGSPLAPLPMSPVFETATPSQE